MTKQYAIGIDLGTTNSVLAYAPLDADEPAIQRLTIPQLTALATVEGRSSLPSFLYLPLDKEVESGGTDLPWGRSDVGVSGEMARRQSADAPDRTVVGAKSWLSHSRVDRHEPILPWGVSDEIPKVSPVNASRLYLEHLIAAWSTEHPDAEFAEQAIVLTVPASFDASARELTREAALAAGFPEDFVLLEEPRAAVYAWLAESGEAWRKQLALDDILLVCDVGGGTTDLTLVVVKEEDGELILERLAVGDHLLIGGDNMDLALAHHAASIFSEQGVTLDPWQSVSLWHSCRAAKETLFQEDGPETQTISIKGRGSKLVGGTVSIEIDREATAELLLEGFLPECESGSKPKRRRVSGFREIGLPFESDTAITRHISAFLKAHGSKKKGPVQPTHVLFNGGVFKASPLRERLSNVLGSWASDQNDGPQELDAASDLDHAVAHGAAYYGWTKTNGGVRIRGGTARSYYVGIETSGLAIPGAPRPLNALCVAPIGMEEGTDCDVPSQEIGLVVGESAHFRIFSSTVRKEDQPGDLLSSWTGEELLETDSMETTLEASEASGEDAAANGEYVPVRFETRVTELGMLELWCRETTDDSRWKLEFSVREDE